MPTSNPNKLKNSAKIDYRTRWGVPQNTLTQRLMFWYPLVWDLEHARGATREEIHCIPRQVTLRCDEVVPRGQRLLWITLFQYGIRYSHDVRIQEMIYRLFGVIARDWFIIPSGLVGLQGVTSIGCSRYLARYLDRLKFSTLSLFLSVFLFLKCACNLLGGKWAVFLQQRWLSYIAQVFTCSIVPHERKAMVAHP